MSEPEPVQLQQKSSRLFREIATLFRMQTAGGAILAIFWLYEFFSQSNLPVYMSDAIVSFGVGICGLASLLLFNRHQGTGIIAITLAAVVILNAYSLLAGRGLNIVLIVFETIILICLLALKKRKEL